MRVASKWLGVPLLLSATVIGLVPGSTQTYDGTWVPLPPPQEILAPSAIYDSSRDRMVVFGGTSPGGGMRSDVWVTDFSTDSIAIVLDTRGPTPPARSTHAAIYDSIRDRMIVYGGFVGSTPIYDVWALDFAGDVATWSPIVAPGAPTSFYSAPPSIFDPVRNRMLVIGAASESTPLQVWSLDLAGSPAWSLLTAAGSPPSTRAGHSATYDAIGDRVIVFGGSGSSGQRNDTHALDLSGTPTWSELVAGSPPPPHSGHVAVYDSRRQRVIVTSGFSADGSGPRGDAYALRLDTSMGSIQWNPLPGPMPRQSHAGIYDSVRDRVVVVHGWYIQSISPSSTFWDFRPPEILDLGGGLWHAVSVVVPAGRTHGSAIYDPLGQRGILFGGESEGSWSNEVWQLDLGSNPRWSSIPIVGPRPSARSYHSSIYDPPRHRMVVFGGIDPYQDDVWTLDLGPTPGWTQLLPAGPGSPGDRYGHTAIYDPNGDRMIVFGGVNDGAAYALALSGPPSWSVLATSGECRARMEHSAVYDSQRARMLVFGGFGLDSTLNDVYALTLNGTPTWTKLVPNGVRPAPRYGASAFYDRDRDRLVIFGGRSNALDTRFTDVWALEGLSGTPTWRELNPAGSKMNVREGACSLYDELADRWILLGGSIPFGLTTSLFHNDVWSLAFTTAPLAVDPPVLRSLSLAAPFPNPTSRSATFVLELPSAGHVEATVFDVSGRAVRTLAPGWLAAGRHLLVWDGRTSDGARAPAGLYFCRVSGAGKAQRRTVVLLP